MRLQQRFRSKKYVFTEKVNRIALGADNKRIQSIDCIETYTYGTSKDIICKHEEIKHKRNIIKQYKKWILWY